MTKLNVTFDQLIDETPIRQVEPVDPPGDPKPDGNDPKDLHPPGDDPEPDPVDPPAEPPADPDPDDPKDPEGGDDPQTVIDIFRQSLGYEVEGEFDESLDGVLEYTRKAIPVAAQQVLEEVFNEFPEAEMLIKHLRDGHSIDTFVEQFRQPELVKTEITDKTDPIILERIVRENLNAKGLDPDEVDVYVNYAKDTNTLFDKAQKSFTEIKTRHEKEVTAKKEAESQKIKQIQEDQIKTWNQVNDIVKSGKIANSIIPDAEKVKFLEFLSKPVKDNMTQRDLKYKEMTLEDHLYFDYLMFKDAAKRGMNDSKKRDTLFEELMKKRNPGRMSPSSTQTRKNVQTSATIKHPKEALTGLKFEDLL